jgi:splicing suppressor protein 51
MSSSETSKCILCGKTENLKKCAKCITSTYCSRDCQKSDWKSHKKICAIQAAAREPGGIPSHNPAIPNPGFHAFNQLLGLQGNDHLHKLSEKDAMTQLIDCFRMRMEDEYTFGQNNFGIYGGTSPIPHFKEFLDLAETRGGLLPEWWSKEKRGEVEQMAQGDSWADINCCIEKSDIQDHYKDNMMPAKLRILGEKIYGKGFM